MDLAAFISDKSIKPKDKTQAICENLLKHNISTTELIAYAQTARDPAKATCIEALEFATTTNPDIADEKCMFFITEMLKENSPRVKWESAKVIGHIACLHPKKLDNAIINLLVNTEHPGTVVRWASAYALGEILPFRKDLLPVVETIIKREEKVSIQKVYLKAIKAIQKKK